MKTGQLLKPTRKRKIVLGDKLGVANRKIIRLGNSAAICIPWSFLERNGLMIGDEVGMVFDHILKIVAIQEKF